MQLTWTHLPQGFKNSPTLFGEALATDLAALPQEDLNGTLVQYVDDLLLTSRGWEDCWEGTKALPQFLTEAGYKVSWKKAQICRQQVRYLFITKGHLSLRPERKRVICSMPTPNTKQKLQEFLGAADFCCIWIPSFSDIARPLYGALTGPEDRPLEWGDSQDMAFLESRHCSKVPQY
ncbi:Gag-Pol polyprotein [Plecturocebus cupreus]